MTTIPLRRLPSVETASLLQRPTNASAIALPLVHAPQRFTKRDLHPSLVRRARETNPPSPPPDVVVAVVAVVVAVVDVVVVAVLTPFQRLPAHDCAPCRHANELSVAERSHINALSVAVLAGLHCSCAVACTFLPAATSHQFKSNR